jgi:hypothetical protein
VDGGLGNAVNKEVHQLHSLHEAMVLIANLVFPGAKSATTVNSNFLQRGKYGLENLIAIHRRRWIAVTGTISPSGNDVLTIPNEPGVEAALNRLL